MSRAKPTDTQADSQAEAAFRAAQSAWAAAPSEEAIEPLVAASSAWLRVKCRRRLAEAAKKAAYKPLWAKARDLHAALRAWGAGKGGEAQSAAYGLATEALRATKTTEPAEVLGMVEDVERRAGLLTGGVVGAGASP